MKLEIGSYQHELSGELWRWRMIGGGVSIKKGGHLSKTAAISSAVRFAKLHKIRLAKHIGG